MDKKIFIKRYCVVDINGFTHDVNFKIYDMFNVLDEDGFGVFDTILVDEFDVTEKEIRRDYGNLSMLSKDIEELYNVTEFQPA